MPAQPIDPEALVRCFREASSFVLACHRFPDGDAIGSMLALRGLLHSLGKQECHCLMEDPVPPELSWLPNAQAIRLPNALPATYAPDLFIFLDAAHLDRLGDTRRFAANASQLICIDHHQEPFPESDLHFIDPKCAATAELVAALYDAADIPYDTNAAECLYVAIATDTGSFRYPNTRPETHALAARLLATGIDTGSISHRLFDSMPAERFQMLVRVLNRMAFTANGRIAYSHVVLNDLRETGATGDDISELVNFGRSVRGVAVAVMFRELERCSTKVSFRSLNDFDCAQAARFFGGGGHHGAAGATIQMPLAMARKAVLDALRQSLDESP